jgi:L-amino acid N-acyltransferase YncA
MEIRSASESDFEGMWKIFTAVIGKGDSYVFSPDTGREDAHAYWFGHGISSFVAVDNGRIIGMYKFLSNQRDLGAHVANASFMVDPAEHGKGIGEMMGRHCLSQAQKAGYLAMQFNFVVSTNTAAVSLWKKLGFSIVGTLPKAFRHQQSGYVDAYVMYRFLTDVQILKEGDKSCD